MTVEELAELLRDYLLEPNPRRPHTNFERPLWVVQRLHEDGAVSCEVGFKEHTLSIVVMDGGTA